MRAYIVVFVGHISVGVERTWRLEGSSGQKKGRVHAHDLRAEHSAMRFDDACLKISCTYSA